MTKGQSLTFVPKEHPRANVMEKEALFEVKIQNNVPILHLSEVTKIL